MANYMVNLAGTRHRFNGLVDLLAKASPLRSGDQLAGIAAESAEHRVTAQWTLAYLPLTVFLEDPVVPPERDEVTRLIQDNFDAEAFAAIRHLTVGGFREWLLDDRTDAVRVAAAVTGIAPEIVAAVTKLMRNQDLVSVARRLRVITRFRNILGPPGRFSSRLQPNHSTDDPAGIEASLVDRLLLGSGDAVIGMNPAGDGHEALRSILDLLDEAAGLAELRIIHFTAAFSAGRIVSYSVYAATAKRIEKTSMGEAFKHSLTSSVGIGLELLMLALLVAFTQVDWDKRLGGKNTPGNGATQRPSN